jgi:hypothetical protein
MNEERREFLVSPEDIQCLRHVAARSEVVAEWINSRVDANDRIIRLTPSEAEQLREILTTQMATVGFDADYEPNEQGAVLERLIDRFFVR